MLLDPFQKRLTLTAPHACAPQTTARQGIVGDLVQQPRQRDATARDHIAQRQDLGEGGDAALLDDLCQRVGGRVVGREFHG